VGSKERRERERTETRGRILDAARELFVEDGVEAVTMRAIADRIDYTPTAIYYHFADKESLILELCHVDMLTLSKALQSVAQVPDPIERLRQLGLAYAEFGLGHPSHYRFLFMTPSPKEAAGVHAHSEIVNPEEDGYLLLMKVVGDAIASGRLRPELTDVEQVAHVVWSGVHGVVSLFLAKGQDPWIEWPNPMETVKLMIDVTMRGIQRE
jgi:AcrR family transcriptional regulator